MSEPIQIDMKDTDGERICERVHEHRVPDVGDHVVLRAGFARKVLGRVFDYNRARTSVSLILGKEEPWPCVRT